MICGRARAAPSALLRRGRRGAQLLPRGRPAAHGRVAAEPGDPAARGRARRRAVHAHDAPRRADRRRGGGCSPTAAPRCRPSTPRSRTRCGRDAACSGRCGSAPRPRRATRSARRCSRGCARSTPGSRSTPRRRRPGTSAASCSAAGSTSRSGSAPSRCPGSRGGTLAHEPMYVLMRRAHRLAGADEVALDALRDDRFVVPGDGLNAGFDRRLRLLCRGTVRARTVVAGDLGRRRVAARRRRRRARDRARGAQRRRRTCAARGSRRSDRCRSSSSGARTTTRRVLQTFLEVATPAPEPAP